MLNEDEQRFKERLAGFDTYELHGLNGSGLNISAQKELFEMAGTMLKNIEELRTPAFDQPDFKLLSSHLQSWLNDTHYSIQSSYDAIAELQASSQMGDPVFPDKLSRFNVVAKREQMIAIHIGALLEELRRVEGLFSGEEPAEEVKVVDGTNSVSEDDLPF